MSHRLVTPAEAQTIATISPFAALGVAVLIAAIVKVPMRLFGRWLQRTGSSMEAACGHPGIHSEASERTRPPHEKVPSSDRPYDPFDAG